MTNLLTATANVELGRTTLEVRVASSSQVISKVKNVYGYEWNKKKACWEFPVDVEAYLGLMREFGDTLRPSTKVAKWFVYEMDRRERILASRDNDQPTLLYEYADRLMPHQLPMVAFLATARRAMNTDQMGLGKTVEMIAALREMELQSAQNPDWPTELQINAKMPRYLIVAPNSMKYTWAREIRTWHPRQDMPIHFIDSGKEGWDKQGWFIINWEKTHRRIPSLTNDGWDAVIGDESHRMKNPNAKQTKAMFSMNNSWNRFLLSGTPIRNHVPDLWPQLHFCDKRRFNSYWKFFDRFVLYQDAFYGGKEILGTKNEEELRTVLGTVQWGRDLNDPAVADSIKLPPVIGPRLVPVELGPVQWKAYEQMRDEFVATLEAVDDGDSDVIKASNWMTQIIRLKQIAGALGIFSEDHKDSAKIDAVLEKAAEAEDEKHVVMSQFRTVAMEYHARLKEEKIPHIMLTGEGTGCWDPDTEYGKFANRDDACVAFNTDPKWKHFVATTQTGGEGITLVGARYFHFLDLMWTPGENSQAWHRVHRKGQLRTVFVFAYLAVNTIDYSGILPTLQGKQAVIDAVFGRHEEVPLELGDKSAGQMEIPIDWA